MISTDTKIDDNPAATQALILGAYLEDKSKWEHSKFNIAAEINATVQDIQDNLVQLKKYSRLKLKIYKLFGIKTKPEKKVGELNNRLSDLDNKLKLILANPPNPQTYELAMLGNLFKVR